MEQSLATKTKPTGRTKFFIGGLLIFAAIVYLIVTSTQANAQYYLTIDELNAKASTLNGRDVRVSGAVLGETIQYNPQTLLLSFTVANVPADNKEIEAQGGLAAVLHSAVTDPNRTHMNVVYNGPKPDLLSNEAQAIMTGHMGQDGVFYANELLLKCPTKYQSELPTQAAGQ
ncbi:MAG: cytochrome c maturation protein CcmE [Chloroflexi bacterium]|nr:cytochrome c maturation protein CcmE [Chloroflexota bacterium]